MILCCDLSSKCTGWSKFSEDGKLIQRGRIVPASDIDNYFKIHYVVEKLKELYKTVDEIIIEDIYVGINPKSVIYLARLSGAVAYSWLEYKYKPPIFYNASHARKLAGINGRCQKAEVQVFVLNRYNFCKKIDIKRYKKEIIKYNNMLKDKTITKGSFKYKMDKLSKLIDSETGIGEDIADCYSEDTEILTNKGWKFFKDLKYSNMVLSLNPTTGVANYQKIYKIIKQKYKGVMYLGKTKTMEFLVTPNHNLFVGDKTRYKFKKMNSFNLNSNNNWKILRTFKWKGKPLKKYKLPELCYKGKNKHRYNYLSKNLDMKNWLEFLGWYISEGCLCKCRNKVNGVCITQVNPDNIKKICKTIKGLGFSYKMYKSKGRVKSIIINSPQLARYLQKLCYIGKISNCYNKKIPDFVFDLDSTNIGYILNTLNLGDGYIWRGVRKFTTSSKKLADGIQELILKTNHYASLLTLDNIGRRSWIYDHWATTRKLFYLITEYKIKTGTIEHNKIEKILYDGEVYCVETKPNHLVYVRKNNKGLWSGNSIVLGIAYGKEHNNEA